jgi:hypothetical protein
MGRGSPQSGVYGIHTKPEHEGEDQNRKEVCLRDFAKISSFCMRWQ